MVGGGDVADLLSCFNFRFLPAHFVPCPSFGLSSSSHHCSMQIGVVGWWVCWSDIKLSWFIQVQYSVSQMHYIMNTSLLSLPITCFFLLLNWIFQAGSSAGVTWLQRNLPDFHQCTQNTEQVYHSILLHDGNDLDQAYLLSSLFLWNTYCVPLPFCSKIVY